MGKGKDFRPPRRRGGFDDDMMPSFDIRPERPPRSNFGGPSPLDSAPPSGPVVEATVSWFNPEKGFGFVAGEDGGKDVFVHISVLQSAGMGPLTDGQRVAMKIVETPKGREAVEISLLD